MSPRQSHEHTTCLQIFAAEKVQRHQLGEDRDIEIFEPPEDVSSPADLEHLALKRDVCSVMSAMSSLQACPFTGKPSKQSNAE